MTETQAILKHLVQPLDMSRVKYRPAPGKDTIPYLEGFEVIQTANDIFDFRWSFDLLSPPQVMMWDQTLTAWDPKRRERTPVLDPETGQPKLQRAGMIYLTGKITIELDGKAYTHADVGRLSFSGDTPEALDTALSGAATDCLKRCFRQLGDQFGLSLYDKQTVKTAVSNQNNGSGQSGNGHKSSPEGQPERSNGRDGMTIEQARAVPCPVGSSQNPQWAGMPLGQVLSQPNGEKMLAYLASDQFKDNANPARRQARLAAQALLKQTQNEGV